MRSGARILRKVEIFFFLEDGTLKVIEPKTDNSGLSQGNWQNKLFHKRERFFFNFVIYMSYTNLGTLISRQRIKLPFSGDLYYDVLDLNIGREVTFYGKVFKVMIFFTFMNVVCIINYFNCHLNLLDTS